VLTLNLSLPPPLLLPLLPPPLQMLPILQGL
jgi:hypothetical protein